MTENQSFLPGDDIHEDVQGHRLEPLDDVPAQPTRPELPADEDEDVEGHQQPPRDLDIERF